jgi:hypothetical protein
VSRPWNFFLDYEVRLKKWLRENPGLDYEGRAMIETMLRNSSDLLLRLAIEL